MKKCVILLLLNIFELSNVDAQLTLNVTFSTPGIGGGSFSDGQNNAMEQIERQMAAQWAAQVADYGRAVVRFDRKLALSEAVVQNMNKTFSQATKYERIKDLYLRSSTNYKQLEPLSQNAARDFKVGKPMVEYQKQEEQIIETGLKDYHDAEDLLELIENKNQIIADGAKNLASYKGFQPSEAAALKEYTDRIRFAEMQIAKLKSTAGTVKDMQNDLNIKIAFQSIGQSLVFLAKIIEATVSRLDVSEKSALVVTVTQAMVEKYVEEAEENGNSPQEGINKAFLEGYDELKKEELLKISSPLKKLSEIPLLAEDLSKEIDHWEKIEKSQQTTLNKVNEILSFTNDGIRRNQQLIDRSKQSIDAITEKAIDRHLSKRLP